MIFILLITRIPISFSIRVLSIGAELGTVLDMLLEILPEMEDVSLFFHFLIEFEIYQYEFRIDGYLSIDFYVAHI